MSWDDRCGRCGHDRQAHTDRFGGDGGTCRVLSDFPEYCPCPDFVEPPTLPHHDPVDVDPDIRFAVLALDSVLMRMWPLTRSRQCDAYLDASESAFLINAVQVGECFRRRAADLADELAEGARQ